LHQSLSEHAQVALSITISDKATPTTTSNDLELTPEIKAALEENVKITYQTVYEAEIARVAQTDILVPVGKIYTYSVYWRKQSFSSTISFTLDGITYTAPYTYSLDLPFLTKTQETGCTA
jgi:hypothetical protein